MSLKQTLNQDLKGALKEKDTMKVSVLRMVLASVSNKEIELRKKDVGLSDEEVLSVLSSEAKKRKDAAEDFKKGGRDDLANKEEHELKIISSYLPEELPDEEVARIVKDGIREAGATSKADFAKVMKVIMPILKGKASGDRISKFVNEALADGNQNN